MDKYKAILMDEAAINRALKRISHEILEKNNGCDRSFGHNRYSVKYQHLIHDTDTRSL